MTNKLLIIILLVTFFHQTGTTQKTFHFGISATPYYTNAWPSKMFLQIAGPEFGIAGLSAGFFVEKQLSDQFSLRFGSEFSNVGYDSPRQFTSWPSENMSGTYVPDPALPKGVAFRNVNRFVDLPLQMRFLPKAGRPFFLAIGAGPLINVNNKYIRIYYYSNGDEDFLGETKGNDGVGLGVRVGAGWQFPLVKKSMLELRPEIRVSKLSVEKYGPRYFQFGLQLAAHI